LSDVANRDRLEAALAQQLAKISTPALRKLITALGSPPSLNNVPDSFWSAYSADLRATLETSLADIYVAQAHTMATEHGITTSVSWDLINQDAADWARAYSFELVKEHTDYTVSRLQDIISTGIEKAQPLSEIQAAVGAVFGADRMAVIATTELTRAAAEGEIAVVAQMADAGVGMVPIWMTREDRDVCKEICAPLNGVRGEMIDGVWQFLNPDDGEYYTIPAHPNDRCSLGWEFAK
jgi:hypothetical protein